MSDEIKLHVDLPGVVETAVRIEVTCGETSAEVYEHGQRGSGNWAAWKSTGYTIGTSGRIGYTREQALKDAHDYVRQQERSRLFRLQLSGALDELDESRKS